jgi:predicted phage terminase large subunit-like protein
MLPFKRLTDQDREKLATAILSGSIPPDKLAAIKWQLEWAATARPKQEPPDGEWNEWGLLAGRGFGKTLTGAQWLGSDTYFDPNAFPGAVIAPTLNDVRHTCFEGPAGLLTIIPPDLILDYNKTNLIITMKTESGKPAIIRGFSAEEPERLRGPQFARLWCFVAGTQVSTPTGDVPIERLQPGDLVLTRKGPRRVAANSVRKADVGRVTFDNGASLVGTADHPVWSADGWVRFDQISAGDPVQRLSHTRPVETTALSVASTWRPEGRQFVYCLKVEGEPEYFANGVLVHNCDELAAWTKGEETWDMAMMGLRLGPLPRVVWTTTPKPKDLVRKLVSEKKGRVITTGSTYENRAHLPQSFFDQLAQYEGTQLGRQELLGELIDAEEGGIVARSMFKLWPSGNPLPAFDWIIMSLDTAFTEKTLNKRTGDADSSACTVWGVFWHNDVRQVMLLDCWSEQYGLPDLMKRVKKELNVAYGDDGDRALIRPLFGSAKPMGSGRKPDILLIEDKGSGISLRQMLDREGITAYAYNPGRADKLARLHMVSHIFARGQVWLPESEKLAGKPKTWIEPMLAQLCSFTGSGSIKHDDYVDSCTQALRLMMDKNLLDMTPMPKRAAYDDGYSPKGPRVNPYAV